MEELSNKTPGSILLFSDWNQVAEEMQNIITSQGLVLTGSDLVQAAKSISTYSIDGDYYSTAGGNPNIIDLGPVGSKRPITAYTNGMRIRFRAANENESGATTIDVDNIGAKALQIFPGTEDLPPGTLQNGQYYHIMYFSAQDKFFLVPIKYGPILPVGGEKEKWSQISPDAVTPLDKVVFSTGSTLNHDDSVVMVASTSFTKDVTAVWVVGTGGGRPSSVSLATDQTWFCFVIAKTDGTVDFGFDIVKNPVNLLADATGFTLYRACAFFHTDGIMDIIPVQQHQDNFRRTGNWIISLTSVPGEGATDLILDLPEINVTWDEVNIQYAYGLTSSVRDKIMQSVFDTNTGNLSFPADTSNLQTYSDFFAKDFSAPSFNITQAGRIDVTPNSLNEIRVLTSIDGTNTAVGVNMTTMSWKVDRRKING